MFHQLIASVIVLVIFGGGFMLVTVIRDKYMGPKVPTHFGECGGCQHKDEDCSAGCRLIQEPEKPEQQ